MTKPAALGAVAARNQIATGNLSACDLLESCIEQIESIDPVVNAMVTRNYDAARTRAQNLDKQTDQGILHGLPIAIKDIHATRGLTTTFGREDFKNNIPDVDSTIVRRIRAAGGVIIGKTNVPEASIGANTVNRLFGATGNAFDPSLTCGGSSGGSGVAIATNMACLATGSDHGGSLRIPACYSGIVGYRATPGVVPNETRTTPQTNYSVPGPMARSVEDVALLLSVIAARDETSWQDPMAFPLNASLFSRLSEIDLSRVRIAVSADLGGVLVSESVKQNFKQRVTEIEKLVAVCDWHDLDISSAPGVDWHIRQDLFVTQFHDSAATWDEDFNPNIRATYESALRTPMADIAAARRVQMHLFQHFAETFRHYDIVITPGVSLPPFPWTQLNPEFIDGKPVENYMAWLALTASLTVVGHPVVAMPCGMESGIESGKEGGTPFGIQVVGPMYSDHRLLSIAHALEQAFAQNDLLKRPIPDFDKLATTTSQCRTLGKNITP